MLAETRRIPWEWATIPLLTALNQCGMKLLAGYMGDTPLGGAWLARALITPWAAVILTCEILSFLLWMRVLAVTDVSRAVPLTAVGYTLILVTGWTFFHEPVLPLEIFGSALILGGVWLLGTAKQ